MFEKEAEEYLDTESKYLIEDNEGNIINIAKKVKQSFKDGAEFGYNKANEWHYVANDDLPKVDNKIVLCICGNGYIDEKRNYILKLLTRKEFPLFQPVYAWKEVTLPKEELK